MTMTTTMTLETLLSLDKNQRDKDIGRSRHDDVEVEESFGLGKLWRSKRVDQLRQTVDPPRRLPPLVPMPRLHRHIGKISMELKHYNESVSESGAPSSSSYQRNIRRQTVVAIFLGVLLMAAVVIPIVVLTAVKSEGELSRARGCKISDAGSSMMIGGS